MLLAVIAACASRASAPAERKPPESELHVGPLTDYVPAAGLRWLLVAEPSTLWRDPELVRALKPLISPARFEAFARATGIDLRRLSSVAVARFDFASLYLAASGSGSALAEQRFAERLLIEPRKQSPHRSLSRLTGVVREIPQTFVRVDEHLIAVSVGDPTPARVVELFALGKLKSVVALKGSSLSSLPVDELEQYPVRFYAAGPFTGEWANGARGLLGRAFAVGIGAKPEGRTLQAVLVMSGDWGGAGQQASEIPRLTAAWTDVAESSLGRLLGLDNPGALPRTIADGDVLRMDIALEIVPIARGLHAAVAADVWEMMDFAGEQGSGSPAHGGPQPSPP